MGNENLSLLQEKCIDRIEDCFDIIEKHFKRKFEMPEIRFDLKGKCGGYACRKTRNSPWIIRLNNQLLIENKEKYIQRTPGHEAAHVLSHYIYDGPKKIRSHGHEWQYIMQLIGQEPSRTHSYSVAPVVRRSKHFVYACSCADPYHYIGAVRHRFYQKGKTRLQCRICKTKIIYKPGVVL